MKIRFIIFTILASSIMVVPSSCKKFTDVPPPVTSISDAAVFTNDVTATAVITGMYSKTLTNGGFASGGANSVTLFAELSADNLVNYPIIASSPTQLFYTNTLAAANAQPFSLWSEMYSYVYTANEAIFGLANNTGVTPVLSAQLTAEAKFIRAFTYFYLTNLFGDVPLFTTTDYTANSKAARSPQTAVYNQIVADLVAAQAGLPDTYSQSATGERIRPTKWAATALLARVYLYMGKYADAEAQATSLINNNLFGLPALNNVFLKNSTETIWALKPVIPGQNTPDAITFIMPATGPAPSANSVALSNDMVTAFETGDNRRTAWVGTATVVNANPALNKVYNYAYKYKVNTFNAPLAEYSIVLRLAEQFLIRAEARAMQNNITGAASDVNAIRQRAGLNPTTASDQATMLTSILRERRVELFAEWGHRWFDLKRTKTVDATMNVATPLKGGKWNTNWQLYPIPLKDILTDPQLSQNAGY